MYLSSSPCAFGIPPAYYWWDNPCGVQRHISGIIKLRKRSYAAYYRHIRHRRVRAFTIKSFAWTFMSVYWYHPSVYSYTDDMPEFLESVTSSMISQMANFRYGIAPAYVARAWCARWPRHIAGIWWVQIVSGLRYTCGISPRLSICRVCAA